MTRLGKIQDLTLTISLTLQRGRAAAIMLSPEAYEQSEREGNLLRLLVRAEREIAKGKGYDLDEVLKEADELLGKKS